MAMIMTRSAPSPRISSTKPGKLVAMKARVVDADRLVAGQPHDESRHGDAVIHVGRDHAAAGARPRPCTIRSSPSISTSTPLTRSISAVAARRSDSFTRSSLRPRIRVVPSRKATPRPRGSGYSSIIDGARVGRHIDAAQVREPARADRRPLRRRRRACRASRSAAPISRSVVKQSGAQRIGHHAFEHDLGARHDQRGDQRKRRRGRIGRHLHRRGRKLGLARQA